MSLLQTSSNIDLADCEIIPLDIYSEGGRQLRDEISIYELEHLPPAIPVTSIPFPHINFRDFVSDPQAHKFVRFVKIKEKGTDIVLPPELSNCRDYIEEVAEYHYASKGFTTEDTAYLHIMQGLLNKGEELNPDTGLHADVSLRNSRGPVILEEDIYCISSCLDTTFYNFPDRTIPEEQMRIFRTKADEEVNRPRERQDFPFQRALSKYFLELAESYPESAVNFGSSVIVNMSSITPHRAQLPQEDEIFRTFLSVHFQSHYKEETVSNPYLEEISRQGREGLLRTLERN